MFGIVYVISREQTRGDFSFGRGSKFTLCYASTIWWLYPQAIDGALSLKIFLSNKQCPKNMIEARPDGRNNQNFYQIRKSEPDIVKDVVINHGDGHGQPLLEVVDERPSDQELNSKGTFWVFSGLARCLRPVWAIVGGKEKHVKDPWTIPFEDIAELHWIGSGAQGAVFLGRYRGEEIAIKKVRHEKDTDIKHLRHLDHRNIVKFR